MGCQIKGGSWYNGNAHARIGPEQGCAGIVVFAKDFWRDVVAAKYLVKQLFKAAVHDDRALVKFL